jgi:Ran GTPase-activating protein (RanGAP) involved in mRNA processing and transport
LQLLAAFQTKRTVTDLTIYRIRNLEDVVLGSCLSALLQNMPQLQRLDCYGNRLRVEGVRAFQTTLQANRTLKQLNLAACWLEDAGICLLADALVGNTIIEVLNISQNKTTSVGLADIARLLESTHIQWMDFGFNSGLFNDADATQHFVTTLQHKITSVQELLRLERHELPGERLRPMHYIR